MIKFNITSGKRDDLGQKGGRIRIWMRENKRKGNFTINGKNWLIPFVDLEVEGEPSMRLSSQSYEIEIVESKPIILFPKLK